MRQLSFKDRLTSWLLRKLLRILSATWRYREEVEKGCETILDGTEPAVIAFLHGKMLPMWYRFRGGKFAALVSTSRDGQLLVDYLEGTLGYRDVVRGSSSKGGRAAFTAMVGLLKEGERSLLVTPDGPRGPAGVPKRGSLLAAQMSGRKILVATWRASRAVKLGSWDSMEIPFPFAAIKCRYCTLKTNQAAGPKQADGEFPISSSSQTNSLEIERFQTLLNAEP